MNDQSTTIVQVSGNIHISSGEAAVLRDTFQGYGRIALEAEYGMGFSGCRVFRVRPVEMSGVAHRPALAKIGPVGLINKEWQAYNSWVKNTLPGIAWVTSEPNIVPGSARGCLRYELVGSGIFKVQSLSQYYRQATIDDLLWVLQKRLFPVMGRSWWLVNRAEPAFQFRSDYDQLLPVNLLIAATESPADGEGQSISPLERSVAAIKTGSPVRLEGLVVTEIEPEKSQLTLNLPRLNEYQLTDSFRLRIYEVPEIGRYQVGDIIDPLDGMVTATRRSMIEEQVRNALGDDIELSQPRLRLAGDVAVSNPLLVYEDILNSFLEVNLSTIHGDFNLENILIDPDTREVKVIDFATVRQGHNLHDLLRLETEVVSKVLPQVFDSAALPPETIKQFYDALGRACFGQERNAMPQLPDQALERPFAMLQAIRSEARKCFFNRDDPTEYYRGLVIYLLGAIKFKNLDAIPNSKKVVFLAAGTIVDQLDPAKAVEQAPAAIPTPETSERAPVSAGASARRLPQVLTGIAFVLLVALAGWLVYELWIKEGPIPVAQFCEIEQKLATEVVDGPAAAEDLLTYFSLANPQLMSHIEEIEQRFLDGQVDQGITYIWGSPGVGKSFITRNRLSEGFPGDNCLIKLSDVFGDEADALSFEVDNKADLTTLDGQIGFDSLPSVVRASDFDLQSVFEVAGCYGDGDLAPLLIFDDIDEIHSETSNLLLKSLDEFVLEAADSREDFVHVFVVGRAEGFTPWYRDTKRTDEIVPFLRLFHLNGPEFQTTGDLEVLANNQFAFVYGAETWQEMIDDGRASELVDGYIRYVEKHPSLTYSVRLLAIATNITDRSHANPDDSEIEMKGFVFDELLRRASNAHRRPLPNDEQYNRMLEEIAILYSGEDTIDDQGFFTVEFDDTVAVMADGEPVGEVFVRDVLDHSGIAILDPASLSTARYKFEPIWVHSHLIEQWNQREDPDHLYRACFEQGEE